MKCPFCGTSQVRKQDGIETEFQCGSVSHPGGEHYQGVLCLRFDEATPEQLVDWLLHYKAGYSRSSWSAAPCPGCVFVDGKFVKACEIHQEMDIMFARLDRYEAMLRAHDLDPNLAYRYVANHEA